MANTKIKYGMLKGPFEARTASVIDMSNGMYVVYCPWDHNGCALHADENAKNVADALNLFYGHKNETRLEK